MKFLMTLLSPFLVVLAFCLPAQASSDAAEGNAEFSFNHGSGFQNYKLGTKLVRDTTHDLLVQYNFSAMGGALTQKLLLRTPPTVGFPTGGPSGTLPKNAIVVGCYIDTTTALGSPGGTTIALSTGQTTGDLLAATAYSSYSGIQACTPTGSASTAIKLTADRQPFMTIQGAKLTAGNINLHIQYLMSDP